LNFVEGFVKKWHNYFQACFIAETRISSNPKTLVTEMFFSLTCRKVIGNCVNF